MRMHALYKGYPVYKS